MRVRRACLLLALCGCLSTGDPVYTPMNTVGPTATADPDVFVDISDGGALTTVQAGQTITFTFSEVMDPASLRPGILIFKDQVPVNLDIQADQVPAQNTDVNWFLDGMMDFHVRVAAAGTTFQQGVHVVVLSTLLVDQQGNPLVAQQNGFFNVP